MVQASDQGASWTPRTLGILAINYQEEAPGQTQTEITSLGCLCLLCAHFIDLQAQYVSSYKSSTKNVYLKLLKFQGYQSERMVNKLLSINVDCALDKSTNLY